jgi:hypothetical protein
VERAVAAERRAPGVSDTFTCENCGETYDKQWSDEEAAAEAEGLFPGLDITDPEEAGMVCDSCFKAIMGRVQVEAPELLHPSAATVPVPGTCYRTPGGMPVHIRPGCRCPK